jgi:hypothetical protein
MHSMTRTLSHAYEGLNLIPYTNSMHSQCFVRNDETDIADVPLRLDEEHKNEVI